MLDYIFGQTHCHWLSRWNISNYVMTLTLVKCSLFCVLLWIDSSSIKIQIWQYWFKNRLSVSMPWSHYGQLIAMKMEFSVFSDSPPNTVMSSNTSERWTFVPNMGFDIKDYWLKTCSCPLPLVLRLTDPLSGSPTPSLPPPPWPTVPPPDLVNRCVSNRTVLPVSAKHRRQQWLTVPFVNISVVVMTFVVFFMVENESNVTSCDYFTGCARNKRISRGISLR